MDANAVILDQSSEAVEQVFPRAGWVEHKPEEIWKSVGNLISQIAQRNPDKIRLLAGIGITNQRETTVVWEKATGRPIHNAIVWQDTRTSDFCKANASFAPVIREKTGLVLYPYFSATKIKWILDALDPQRTRAKNGDLLAGTIDTYLIWKISGGESFSTDLTNASRSLLMNLNTGFWDDELLRFFNVPKNLLPAPKASIALHGKSKGLGFLPDGIPILGVAGDQQAALFGHGCTKPFQAKCTFGTGAFFLVHTGKVPFPSKSGLLTTLAANQGKTLEYALEGSVFVAGSAVQWLRDNLKIIEKASDTQELALAADSLDTPFFIPALAGLGCPHWDSDFQGTILGITRKTSKADLVLATLEGVAHQVADLLEATSADIPGKLNSLKVDGGMVANPVFNQILADITGLAVEPAASPEITSIGAGKLAAVGAEISAGDFPSQKGNASTIPGPGRDKFLRRRDKWKAALIALKGFYHSHGSAGSS